MSCADRRKPRGWALALECVQNSRSRTAPVAGAEDQVAAPIGGSCTYPVQKETAQREEADGGAGPYDLVVGTRLETERLVIRTFEARDVGPWLAMVTDPEVRRFLPAGPAPTTELAVRIIGERQAMEREHGHAMWAVEDKTTGTFVGQCGLRPVDEGAGPEIDLAYHYTPASWNKGYATEAAIAVIGHGLGPVGLAAIMAVVVPENTGSWRVMEKAGMRYQGLVDYYGLKGLKKYIAAREWWSPPLV